MTFTPGLELSRRFYWKVVRPIIGETIPDVPYAAAHIGPGSDVLGFDTEMSTDHDWGPSTTLFLELSQLARVGPQLRAAILSRIPTHFEGYPTHFRRNPDGTDTLDSPGSADSQPCIAVLSVDAFIQEQIGFDINQKLEAIDWLTFPEQKLLEITSGMVFHDQVGLEAVRVRFLYYPRDVWLYQLAAAWNRIGQEEHLMGRAGSVGDEIGSAIIGARLVRDVMRVCFLLERRYAPYPKWFGSEFSRLRSAKLMSPSLLAALSAGRWSVREEHLSAAYEIIADLQNQSGLIDPLPGKVGAFYNRPFQVIHLGNGFARALCDAIQDPQMRRLASARLIGGMDAISDNTDILCGTEFRRFMRAMYGSVASENNLTSRNE